MEAEPDCWFQSLMVTPPKIAGVRLLPYSLAHHAILSGLGSPYSIGGIPSRQDVLIAIQVCSKTWDQNRAWLDNNPADVTGVMGWLISLGRFSLRRMRWTPFNWRAAHDDLMTYIEDYGRVPDHIRSGDVSADDSAEIKAPYEWHIVRILCTAYGMTHDQAWNCPLNLAKCYADTWAESNGDDTMLSRWDVYVDACMDKINKAASTGNHKEADRMTLELQSKMDARRRRT